MKRADLLRAITYAGYHEDTKTGTRLLIEGRVSMQVYNEQFNIGRQMKANGMRCGCRDCTKGGA